MLQKEGAVWALFLLSISSLASLTHVYFEGHGLSQMPGPKRLIVGQLPGLALILPTF